MSSAKLRKNTMTPAPPPSSLSFPNQHHPQPPQRKNRSSVRQDDCLIFPDPSLPPSMGEVTASEESTNKECALANDDDDDAAAWQSSLANSRACTLRNFIYMSLLFSAVPATALACLSLAVSRFGTVLGAWQSGILYLTYTVSAISGISPYVVTKIGSRNSLITGMTLYCSYVACFWLAAVVAGRHPNTATAAETENEIPLAKLCLALFGATVGGTGAGIMWTAQGVYFSQAAEEYSLLGSQLLLGSSSIQEGGGNSNVDWEESTSRLAGIFAFILLVEETTCDLSSSFLIRSFGLHWSVVFALYAIVAVLATLGMLRVHKYPSSSTSTISSIHGHDENDREENSSFVALTSAVRLLWSDPKMKYMIGLNASFGFAGAFLNSFVSGEVVPIALDDPESSFVGVYVAVHGATAAISSLCFGKLASYTGKGPILVLGALCFGSVALPFLVQPNLDQWSWRLLTLVYALEGIGRATFEGTLKATFADYFSHEKEGAFSNIILQNGLASVVAYVLSFRLTCDQQSTYCIPYRDGSLHNLLMFGGLVVGMSVLAVAGYWRASCLFRSGIGGNELSRHYHKSVETSCRKSLAAGNDGLVVNPRRYPGVNRVDHILVDEDEGTGLQLPQIS